MKVDRYLNSFTAILGDLHLDELKLWHITQNRDMRLAQDLHPNSIHKHNNKLNAMINMAFKHLDIDRLTPFRVLKIRSEGEALVQMERTIDQRLR
jgi:hypothetical protein